MKIFRKFKQNTAGFTLVEVIVAVSVIIVGVIAVLELMTSSVTAATVVRQRIIAANLVQEGLEVIRNVRENNWLQNQPWNTNLSPGNYEVEYYSSMPFSYTGSPLLFDQATGVYSHTIGNPTPYVRKITITAVSPIEMRVEASVTWVLRDKTLVVAAEDHLFNWR